MSVTNRDSEPGPSTSSGLGGAVTVTESTVPDHDFLVVDGPFVDRRLNSEEVVKMWNLSKIIKQLGIHEQCVVFAEANGMVHSQKICHTHRIPMRLAKLANKSFGAWICMKGKILRTAGTLLIYACADKWSYEKTMNEDAYKEERERCLGKTTIVDWFSYCRESIVIYYLEKMEHSGNIGGPGKVVQIDESKFGKWKYNKGRHIEGHWVLGMIEDRSEDLRLEVCPDNIAEVLAPLIKNI